LSAEAQAARIGARIRSSTDLLLWYPYVGHAGEVPGTRVRKVAEQAVEVIHIYHERREQR
jgi:hypothetical protein